MAMELHPFLEPDVRPSPKWWYVLSTAGDPPSMRVGHSASFVPAIHANEHDRVFIIGGALPNQVFSEVYVLDLQTRSWDTLEANGFRGRYEHSAFAVKNHPGKLFVFGGSTLTENLNDVQCFIISSGMWSDVEISGTPPTPRTHRCASVIESKVYFYSGGFRESEAVADRRVHCLDTETMTWSALTPRGDSPKPRQGHVMVPYGNKIYLHGGMAGSTVYDDLHILDIEHDTWTSVKKKKKGAPPPRASHEGVICDDSLYIFAGMNLNGALDDVYKLNIENNVWSKVEFEGPTPANRLDFALCTIKLRVPLVSSSDAKDSSDLCDITSKAQEVLEQELKPGSASSRDSFSDSGSVNDSMCEAPDSVQGNGLAGAANIDGCLPLDETEEVTLVIINGGMDAEGEIFDDTLIVQL